MRMALGSLGIKQKLVLLSLVVLLLVSFGFTLLNLTMLGELTEDDLRDRAVTFAREIAATIGDRREFESGAILRPQIDRILAVRHNVLQLDVLRFGSEGTTVIATSHPATRLPFGQHEVERVRRGQVVSRLVSEAAGRYWEVVAPIALEGSVVGGVAAKFSLQRADALAARIRFQALALAAASVVVMGLLMGVAIEFVVNRPIRRFLGVIARIEQGETVATVVVDANDEFRLLARHFNEMVVKLADFHAELQARVKDATQELESRYREVERLNDLLFATQRRLSHAERLALSGRIMAEVAHEVGTPLHSIAAHVQLLREDRGAMRTSPDAARRVEIIDAQLRRVTEIIGQLLDLTRRPSGVTERMDLAAVIRDTVDVVRPGLASAGLAIQVRNEPPLPAVRGQRHQLQQVILNLLTNAIDATPAGGTIRVSAVRAPGRVEIEVADTGCGIPEVEQERIFEPFFTTKETGRGTHWEARTRALGDAQDDGLRLARVAILEQENAIREVRQLLVALVASAEARGGDVAVCNAYFARLLADLPRYANFGTVRPDGDVVCSGIPLRQPVNLADRGYVRRAFETGRFAIGEYQMGRVTGRPTLNFAHPIRDGAGRVQSVVYAALDLAWLSHLAARAGLPRGSTLSVFDTNGLVLARHPDPQRWVGKTIADAPIVQAVRATAGEATAEDVGLDGVRRVFAFAPLPKTETGGNVFVVVGIPVEAVLGGVNRSFLRNLIACGVVTVLALGIGWVGSGRLVVRDRLAPSPFASDPRDQRLGQAPALARGYAVAVAAILGALGLEWVLWPLVEPSVSPPFFAAVMVSAWYGGLGPGLVATALAGVASAFFFMPPLYSLSVGVDDLVRLIGFASVAVLISVLNSRRARAEAELARRLDQQTRVADLGRQALGDVELAKLVDEATGTLAHGLGVEVSGLLEVTPNRDGLVVTAGVGWRGAVRGTIVSGPETESYLSHALRSAEPVVSVDAREESRFTWPPVLRDHGLVTVVSMPVYGRDRTHAVLVAGTTRQRSLSRHDLSFVQSVAHVITMGVQRASR